ncbi:YlxR family protein [Actinospica durhamensis]|uniref:YlxR family protein n=1 Tax=Actinospica durhamensis TaxID=1508375 RepID=A0A941EMB8_9ACTN|nr:YlxR family protein [Actinospica durhamensis]MBR7833751.1 YlxR family protein [Actinospica durhamensis]
MCVGCRERGAQDLLLRVVAEAGVSGGSEVRPDPRRRLPGRGAYVHPRPECLALAERKRAFPRALRLPGPLDLGQLHVVLDVRRSGE